MIWDSPAPVPLLSPPGQAGAKVRSAVEVMSDELALVVVFSGAHTRARAAILDWLAQCVSIMPPSAGQGRLPRVVYTT